MNHKHFINVRRMPSDAYDLQYIHAQCFVDFFFHNLGILVSQPTFIVI